MVVGHGDAAIHGGVGAVGHPHLGGNEGGDGEDVHDLSTVGTADTGDSVLHAVDLPARAQDLSGHVQGNGQDAPRVGGDGLPISGGG